MKLHYLVANIYSCIRQPSIWILENKYFKTSVGERGPAALQSIFLQKINGQDLMNEHTATVLLSCVQVDRVPTSTNKKPSYDQLACLPQGIREKLLKLIHCNKPMTRQNYID